MKPFLRLLAAFAAMISLKAATAVPIAKDWSKVATRTASGSMLQGNPDAPVKLVEFLSLTCPHCAHFESTAGPLTPKYIKSGQVSYEVRIALRDPFDLVAALLARCGGPDAFFAVKPALYAAQGDWLGKGYSWAQSAPELDKMAEIDAAKAVAKGSGLDVFFAKRGLTPARINACLADTAEEKLLSQRADEIWKMPGFPGTPAFSINGELLSGIGEWPALDTALAAALAKSGHKG